MREIKFRGLNDYGWHVGHLLISYKDRAYIVTDMIDDDYANVKRSQEVELSTVGQYTGLKDKNGVEIYEGDIIEQQHYFKNYDGTLDEFFKQSKVVGDIRKAIFGLYDVLENITVIGNRFENPELLEGVKDGN